MAAYPLDPRQLAGIGLTWQDAKAYRIAGRRRYTPAVARLSRDLWAVVPLRPEQRAALLVSVIPPGGAISHDSAAWWYGLPTDRRRDRSLLHVTVPSGGPASQRRQFAVHVRMLPAGDVTVVKGVPVTTPERLFIDMSAVLDTEQLVALGDAILNQRWATADSLAARVAAARRARGVCLARRCLPMLDGRAQSPPESTIRVRLRGASLPPATPQLAVDLGFAVVHLDLGWEQFKIGVEYEGSHHAESAQFGRDLHRYSELAARGWLIIRAGRRDLAYGSGALLDQIRAALRLRGWDPPHQAR